MNDDAPGTHAEIMVGRTGSFLTAYQEQREKPRALGRRLEKGGGESFEHVVVTC